MNTSQDRTLLNFISSIPMSYSGDISTSNSGNYISSKVYYPTFSVSTLALNMFKAINNNNSGYISSDDLNYNTVIQESLKSDWAKSQPNLLILMRMVYLESFSAIDWSTRVQRNVQVTKNDSLVLYNNIGYLIESLEEYDDKYETIMISLQKLRSDILYAHSVMRGEPSAL